MQDGDATQNSLHNDGAKGGERKIFHPAAAIYEPSGNRYSKGKQDGEARDHAVAVLIENASDHAGHAKGMECGRPVRDGKASVIAGDKCSSDDEEKSRKGGEHRKTVVRPVIWRGQRGQS